MRHFIRFSVPLFLTLLLLNACITEEVADNTAAGNFDALWTTLDRHYCFFPEKGEAYGLDWNAVRAEYRAAVVPGITPAQLFEVCGNMLSELRDGHVNLVAAHDVASYTAWYDDYPANYSDSLERIYLGKGEEYFTAAGLKYKVLDGNVGYVRCESFDLLFGDGNLYEIMNYLASCDGLIVDVRNNGGGMLTAAEKLASLFVDGRTCVGYMSHKTGPGHDDFSSPQPLYVDPFPSLRWQKPVAVLTNRRTYSAANSFAMYMSQLPGVVLVGDRTGGGAGMPFTSELPNGWSVRFSACPMYDGEMHCTESGIDPDIKVDISSADYARGVDTLIETAKDWLKSAARRSEEEVVGA